MADEGPHINYLGCTPIADLDSSNEVPPSPTGALHASGAVHLHRGSHLVQTIDQAVEMLNFKLQKIQKKMVDRIVQKKHGSRLSGAPAPPRAPFFPALTCRCRGESGVPEGGGETTEEGARLCAPHRAGGGGGGLSCARGVQARRGMRWRCP